MAIRISDIVNMVLLSGLLVNDGSMPILASTLDSLLGLLSERGFDSRGFRTKYGRRLRSLSSSVTSFPTGATSFSDAQVPRMYPTSSQLCGVPIERVDGRPWGLVDDALSQACSVGIEEVDAYGLLMVDDGVNLDEDNLEWAGTDVNDRDEVGSGTFSTPKKVDGEKGVVSMPFVGQVFDRWESAYDFYNAYGLATGFGVRKSSTMTSMKSKTKLVISRKFVCDREEVKRDMGKVDNVKEMRERRAVRLDCKGKMVIKLRDEKWVVKTFEDIHSHELTSPLKTKMLRSHNRFHKASAREGSDLELTCC
ncbi:uncharacterized protein LOC143855838 [Tasmannia lanceolata]|uniref:uncharacterized protein LOC143855838 n=1 Tax=Tasmannia lanceolata TaxID=3420 RepID=UPI0040631ED9